MMGLSSAVRGHLRPEREVERLLRTQDVDVIAGVCRVSTKQVGRRLAKGAPFLRNLGGDELLDLGAAFPSLSTAIVEDQLGTGQPSDPVGAPRLAVELGALMNRAAALLAEGNGDHRWHEGEIAPLRDMLPEIARRIPHLLCSLDAACVIRGAR